MKNETKEETINYGIPLNGNILVKRSNDVKAKIGGIHIPDNAQQRPSEGYVLCVGEPAFSPYGFAFPQKVKVGDRVLFGKYVGTEVEIDGQEYMILLESAVAMILPKKSHAQIEEDAMLQLERGGLIIQ